MSEIYTENKPNFIKLWLVAVRPFSLTASVIPVLFGTVIAVTTGGASFRPLLFLCAFFGMLVLHSGANLLNDVYDYRRGVDRQINPVSGAVVRKWLSEREAFRAALFLMGLGIILGIYIFLFVGLPILYIGFVGIIIGILYTWGPFELKYHGLGDLAVFLTFGILGSAGAWIVQTGSFSWIPVVWAVPMSLIVIAILHANNWRDISSDTRIGIKTVSSLLGDRMSKTYYDFLLISPFIGILMILVVSRFNGFGPPMPWTFLICFAALPPAVKLMKMAGIRHKPEHLEIFRGLDGATGKLNFIFGLLCVAAPLLDVIIQRMF
ncbi:MAG: 1,4-dihydroxy-2-naphthoate octaprenyltransferase [Desulfobacterales bacterium]|nr:1,4-dihydroxy-2-naphthoate octaprenyltransferase [Desulfobacterales bacterium]